MVVFVVRWAEVKGFPMVDKMAEMLDMYTVVEMVGLKVVY